MEGSKWNPLNLVVDALPAEKKTAKIEIVLEPNIKAEFMELIASEGKTASVEIGAWIRQYIKDMKKSEIKRGDKI